MVKKFLSAAALAMTVSVGAWGADYGLPANIQDGNILHCFDWTCAQVEAELDNIAKAGFGSVQLSPMQGNCNSGAEWYYAYMPYDFALKGSGVGTKAQLTSLCAKAHERGIKVIVDVVANHVNQASGYHDKWWDSNGRVRWNGGINYNDRYSVTHGQLGEYGDVNSEDSQVQARAKAYVEELKSCGVDGIRWDAAKHIGLPSEGCGFWSTVTSVPGMWHYGEILDSPGGDGNKLMKEYTTYMSVTDNGYCDGVRNAVKNGGAPSGFAGWAAGTISDTKVVYWAESHDDYSNEWQATTHIPQEVIDRTWAIVACRNGASSLYFSRPFAKSKDAIKMGVKGSTHFTSKEIAAINKLRNTAVGHADYFSSANGVVSVTRKDVGAAIIKGNGQAGNVSITNGGGYCPAGTYTDQVSGSTFTVTATTISGNVGSTGIAVLIKDGSAPSPDPDPEPNPGPNPEPEPTGSHYIYYDGTFSAPQVWAWNASGNCTTATAWPGDNMVKMNNMWYWEVPAGKSLPAEIIIHEGDNKVGGGDLAYVDKATYHQDGSYTTGDNPNPNPDPNPDPTPGKHTVYFDNSTANWSAIYCYAWSAGAADHNAAWPGVKMTKVNDNVYSYTSDAAYKNVIFSGSGQTDDLDWVDGHIYKKDGSHSLYQDAPNPGPAKPVVTISPNGGKVKGTASITVSVTGDATTVSGTFNGKALTLANGSNNVLVSQYLTADGQQGTLSVSATNDAGTTTASASFIRSDAVTPPTPPAGDNLITEYYKVNPDGQFGSNRTVNMSFSKQNATGALSHWTEGDLIAQGVARDVAQAMKGVHERPVIDSYAIYAAYDSQNLYLGVQFVYTVWDLYGEGKQPGESKPYNMDGRLMLAFDLDPESSFDGYIDGKQGIWNDANSPGAKFNNGVDAIWIGSTKPGVGTPGFFVPTPDGHASYDAPYCKTSTVKYGYADGLASCIENVWGQKELGFEPEVLVGNDGFVDLRSEIDDTAHTFYEFQIPLSLLGVTESYIKNNGIGVQYLDVYGSSPVGGTPYDPAFFDNVKNDYSMDPSSSQEKEDEDIITYAPARIGKSSSGVGNVSAGPGTDNVAVYGGKGVINILGADGLSAVVASVAGQVCYQGAVDGNISLNAAPGLYIVNVAGKGYKVIVR